MRGALVALDDAGSGCSGLQQRTTVRPHLVELDRALVTGIHDDVGRAVGVVRVERVVARAAGRAGRRAPRPARGGGREPAPSARRWP